MEDFNAYLNQIQPLSAAAWNAIVQIFRPGRLNKGEWFAVAGEPAAQIGFLQSGILRAYHQNRAGQDYNKTFFQAPVFFGAYSALVTGGINQIHIQALTPCTILQADFAEMRALYVEHRDLERLALRLMEATFVAKEQREIDLVMLNARERYFQMQVRHPNLEREIPQYHIASYLGISPTQLSRIRADIAKGKG